MKWKDFRMLLLIRAVAFPLLVVLFVSAVSKHFILDNPDFWYGYMSYTGTVALAGAALWQNYIYVLANGLPFQGFTII